jgi:hypothetical protein
MIPASVGSSPTRSVSLCVLTLTRIAAAETPESRCSITAKGFFTGTRFRLAFFALLSLIAGSLLSTGQAEACTCAGPATPAEGFERSTAVFRGAVIEISRPFLDRIGLTRSGAHRVKFAVEKHWKGASANTVEVVTRLTAEGCGFPFEEKKEYLVYVVTEPKDIQTGLCTGTKSLAGAEPEMKQLDDLVATLKR